MDLIKRIKVGVPPIRDDLRSIDELLEGGIPKNNLVLVTGPTGSGKSILSLQFLVTGIEDFGERGMYISFEQGREDIIKSASIFGWAIEDYEAEGKMEVISFNTVSDHVVSINKEIENKIDVFKPERIVFDSISSYIVYMEAIGYLDIMIDYDLERKVNVQLSPEVAMRRSIMQLLSKIRRDYTTAFLISERPEGGSYLSRDTISEFLVDGVLVLDFIGVGTEEFGTIQIRKMRNTSHARSTFQTYITSEGMKIGEESIGTLR